MSRLKVLRRARLIRDTCGIAAVEFALIAPVFAAILVGIADFGGALYTKFSLDSAVAAAANYTLQNSASVTSAGGSRLAISIANIAASGHADNWANGTVVINNGPSATLSGGIITTGGTASNADNYYCPSRSGSAITWGTSTAGNTICASGALSGRFVQITASRAYSPIFASYNLIKSNSISTMAVVQAQ